MRKLLVAVIAFLLTAPLVGAGNLAGKKIYINPGHGGFEATAGTRIPGQFGNGYRPDGSVSTDRWNPSIPYPNVCEEGCWESKHNLWRGLELQRLLEQAGATVKMSRTQNRNEDDRILTEIGEEATAWNADMFISIHSNGNGSNHLLTLFRGADPRPGQTDFNINDPAIPESKVMATTGWRHLHDNPLTCWQARKDPTAPYAVSDSAFYSSWTSGYHLGVFRKLWVPGFLAEIAFHDYKPETHRMLSEDYSKIIAFMLYTSICEYFEAPLPTTGIIAGEVKDSKRILRDPLFLGATFGDHDQYKPLNGAKVTITGNGVNKQYITDNNYNGIFYFPDMAPGTYNIKVEMDGYTTYEGTTVCEAAKTRGPIVMLDDPSYDPAADRGRANIYASALEAVAPGTVRFTLNADATSVTLNLLRDGVLIKSIDLGAQPRGTNTVSVPETQVANGDYQWSITAKAEAIAGEPVQITENGDPILDIANARGIAIDKNPASPFFGRVYVTSSNAGKQGTRTGQGVYVLDAALSDVTLQGNSPYGGGQSWTNAGSPMRIDVGEDGKVWICDWSDNHSGVWIMDPANPSANFTEFFGGSRNADGLATQGSTQIHGSIVDLCVTGSGANTRLYTLDEDIVTPGVVNYQGAQAFNLPYRYDIGTTTSAYVQAPDRCYGNFDTKYVNGNATITSDGRGGLWVGQYRDTNSSQFPCAMHINANGSWDYFCSDTEIFKTSAVMGALGVSPDGKYIAVAGKSDIRVAEITWSETGTPSLALKYAIGSTYGARPFACDFDVAGNLYVVYNDKAGGVGAWALPKDANEYTTTANDMLKVSAGIAGNLLSQGGIHYVDNIVTADGTFVEIFSITGAKMAEGYRVDISTLPAGVYVVRAGTDTLKIRK